MLHNNDDDNDHTSDVVIEARYVPVPVELEPRETVNSTSLLFISQPNHDNILKIRVLFEYNY